MGTGQFCTNPGLVLLLAGEATERFVAGVTARFDAARPSARCSRAASPRRWPRASPRCRRRARSCWSPAATAARRPGYSFCQHAAARLGRRVLAAPESAADRGLRQRVAGRRRRRRRRSWPRSSEHLEGNLTGCIYSRHARHRRRAVRPARAAAAPARGPAAERQDADRRRRQPGDEPRRPVSRRPAIPASRPSAFPRRCAASRCCSATTTSARAACPAVLRDEPPHDRVWRLVDGEWRRGRLAGA